MAIEMKKKTTDNSKIDLVRLNKFISSAGVASRRKADELTENGKVKVNGKTVYELGSRINPRTDKVTVKGKPIWAKSKKIYLMFNKPERVLTTMNDPEGRPTVGDFIKKKKYRLFPVGRLDWESEGLLLLTNDGDFSNEVMHPKSKITKTYLVKLNGQPTESNLQKLLKGVSIVGGKVKAVSIGRVKRSSSKYDWIRIGITEGKNRQIRRMFEKIGFDVKKLRRVSIGKLNMGGLKKGEFIELKPSQLEKIFT